MTLIIKSFEECVEKITYGNKIQKNQYLDKGQFPIISQELDLVNGYWNIEDDIYKVDKPVIIFGDHTRTLKYVNFNFVLGADGTKIIKPKNFIDSRYFYYFLLANPIDGKGYSRHYKFLKDLKLIVIGLEEQKVIVEQLDAIFAEIDIATASAQANVINAEAFFRSILKNIFDKDVGTYGFVKLGEVCEVVAGQSPESKNYNKNGEGMAFYQGKKDFGDIYINPPSVWTTEITKKAFKDDILMSVRAPVGPVNIATEPICIGRGLAAIRASSKINQAYLFNFLLKIEKDLIGNAGAVFNSINKAQIENLDVPLPPVIEQQKSVSKIIEIKTNIDIKYSAEMRKVKELEILKQAILKKAFSGQLVKD
jgi:type I restriction enzyme S subunit